MKNFLQKIKSLYYIITALNKREKKNLLLSLVSLPFILLILFFTQAKNLILRIQLNPHKRMLIKKFKTKKLAENNMGKNIEISKLMDINFAAYLLFEEYDNGSIRFAEDGIEFIIKLHGLDHLADLLLENIINSDPNKNISKKQHNT